MNMLIKREQCLLMAFWYVILYHTFKFIKFISIRCNE